MDGKLAISRIDVYKSDGLAKRLKVEKYPAVVTTVDGKITNKTYEMNEETIKSLL
jgi:thioredoxin-like negative regulator of GroEL